MAVSVRDQTCFPFCPLTHLLPSLFATGSDKVDEKGLVRVTPELQVEGLEDVYAIGDCCNTDQEKMAAHAQDHGECVGQNIARSVAGHQRKPYKQSMWPTSRQDVKSQKSHK